jgi:hypothetical protein
VGADFDERLLQRLADAGAGHFYFIETAVQIPDLLTSELGEALETVARSAALLVDLPAGAQAEPLNPFRHERTAPGLRIELGDLVSSQEVAVVVKLTFPRGTEGDAAAVRFRLEDREHALGDAWQAMVWMFAGRADHDAEERDRVVDRAVAGLQAAKARTEALELNRAGRYDDARRVLETAARLIREYAGNDIEMNRIADELVQDVSQYEASMSAPDMKARHFASYTASRMRAPTGKARKGPRE